jgi:hypothetical protein
MTDLLTILFMFFVLGGVIFAVPCVAIGYYWGQADYAEKVAADLNKINEMLSGESAARRIA